MMQRDMLTTQPVVSACPWPTKLLAAGTVLAVCLLPWYQLNLTSSAPRGVWLRSSVPPIVEHGMWVTLPVPRIVEPWVSGWALLLKPVAAVAGEWVCAHNETLWIGGQSYGQVYQVAQGKPLPHLEEGCFEVEAGRVFLASAAARSMDSRYFGAIPISVIAGRATPLWTWR